MWWFNIFYNDTLVEEDGHLGLVDFGVTTLEEGVIHLKVEHIALGTLETPCTYAEKERLS